MAARGLRMAPSNICRFRAQYANLTVKRDPAVARPIQLMLRSMVSTATVFAAKAG